MSPDSEKHLAAQAAVDLIKDGMVVGLGSGSTSLVFVKLLAERVKNGLKIKGVPTSEATANLATELGIELVSFEEYLNPDIDVDGADEVDPNLCLIKGGGGKLLREKIVAFASKKVVIIVDSSKLVNKLGKFKLPIEIIPFAREIVETAVRELHGKPVLRKHDDGSVYTTDENNWILDCDFGLINNPPALSKALNSIPGLVEHGLFIDLVDTVFVGTGKEVRTLNS